jgi:hypothetical protein
LSDFKHVFVVNKKSRIFHLSEKIQQIPRQTVRLARVPLISSYVSLLLLLLLLLLLNE